MPTLIDKICPICKKPFKVEIKRINQGEGIYCSISCTGKAKYKGGIKVSQKRSREKRYNKHLAYNLKYNCNYRNTIRGHLILTFHKMKERCENPKHCAYKWYKNIKCLFKSSTEFANYVINKLQIDPRGLEIHRINNKGHYKPGNIEFLTSKEHGLKHRKNGQ